MEGRIKLARRLREILGAVKKERPKNIDLPIMIFAYFETNDAVATAIVRHYLVEGGKTFDLGRGYTAAFHRAHVPGAKDHLHFRLRGRDLYSINRDGTAHDASHGQKLHNQVVDGMRALFPDFTLPPNNIIESYLKTSARVLVEAALVGGRQMVPRQVIITAMNKATI